MGISADPPSPPEPLLHAMSSKRFSLKSIATSLGRVARMNRTLRRLNLGMEPITTVRLSPGTSPGNALAAAAKALTTKPPAARAPAMGSDAVGRIDVEDGLARMPRPAKADAKTSLPDSKPKTQKTDLTTRLFRDLKDVRPTVLKGVPKFWEQLHTSSRMVRDSHLLILGGQVQHILKGPLSSSFMW